MQFFLFLYLRGKEKERAAKKEKETTQLLSASSLRSAAFSIRLCRIFYARYCALHTLVIINEPNGMSRQCTRDNNKIGIV